MVHNLEEVETIIELAPPFSKLPVSGYGGIERVVWSIARELSVRASNDPFAPKVELWAPGDSETKFESADIHLHPTVEKATGIVDGLWNTLMRQIPKDMYDIRRRLTEDRSAVAHLHTPLGMGAMSGAGKDVAFRTLTTFQSPPPSWALEFHKDMPVVAVSHAQAKMIKGFDFMHVVYNGIESDLFKPSYQTSANAGFSFLGRFSPDKNPIDAIKIALACDASIGLAGQFDPNTAMEYADELKGLINSSGKRASLVGEVTDLYDSSLGESSKNAFLSSSKALLFPIKWKEPFGIVIAEANACGTPVIAYNYPGSSVDELIVNGVNGYKVNSLDEAIQAAQVISNIDRRKVRKYFEENFTSGVMVDKYCKIFTKELPKYCKASI
jgi:glycosyltransferase involved in cell wall biosynthesis